MNNKPYSLNRTNKTTGIYRSIEQIWQKVNILGKSLSNILSLYDIQYKISDLLFFINFNKKQFVTKRIESSDSPYTVGINDRMLFCDTTLGSITVNLPAGINGTNYRIINTGLGAYTVTITPNDTELLFGVNSSDILYAGEDENLVYETTEGWW
jgi:hypothetical protein